jgi:hypothetical protein
VTFFEKIRKELGRELDVIRQKRRLEAEFKRREKEDRERSQRESEEARRRVEELSRRITLRTVEKRPFIVNFLPFGAGQFQQSRNGLGVFLAVSEGATAATSIISYLALNFLIRPVQRRIPGFQTPDGFATFIEYGILKSAEGQATVWRYTKVISGALFYLLYGLGVADALFHHEDEVVTTVMMDAPPVGPQNKPVGPAAPKLAPEATFRPSLIPVPGGAGAGVSGTF